MLGRTPFESGAPVWRLSCLCPQGLPQLLLPWDRAQDKCFKCATPEKTSRCPWGSLKAVQVLEVLFRILYGASLHLQAPEDVKSLSHSL